MPKENEQFSENNIPKSNWMKFDVVGNSIIGTFLSKAIKPANGDYPAQMVYTVFNAIINDKQQESGDEWNFGAAIREGNANFINNKFAKVKPGTRIGLKFMKEIPPKKKGFHPAKSYMPNVFLEDGQPKIDPLFNQLYGENFNTDDAVKAEDGELSVESVPFN